MLTKKKQQLVTSLTGGGRVFSWNFAFAIISCTFLGGLVASCTVLFENIASTHYFLCFQGYG